MNPQLSYALKKAAIQIVLAVLAVVATEQSNILEAADLDPAIYGGIIAAVVTALARTFEGYRDGQRAGGATAHMQSSDVGFEQVLTKAEVEGTAHLMAAVDYRDPNKVDVHVVRDSPSVVDPFLTDGAAHGTTNGANTNLGQVPHTKTVTRL
jgi:hypothetical protein